MTKITKKRALAAMEQYAEEYTNIEEIVARQNSEIAETNEQYSQLLVGPSTILGKAKEIIETYTEQNKDNLFDEKSKTAKLGVGEVSIRQTPSKIAFLKGWSASKVIEKIKKKYKDNVDQYLKTKVEVDKTAVKKLGEKELKYIGLELQSEEKISIKLPLQKK